MSFITTIRKRRGDAEDEEDSLRRKEMNIGKLLLKGILTVALTAMVSSIPFIVKADGENYIYTKDDLMKIAEDPTASYVLMDDIDMSDAEWKPIDFTGNFDGNNHAILNLKITETSEAIRTTYDGNYKVYDTSFAGMFGALENASVKNLTLLGIDVNVQKDAPCFVGTIAGFAEGSNIENCHIEGMVRLDANSKMFGVGGIVGYGGNGAILNTYTDTTLICIDHDAENRDEQFMGGAYSAGYIDVNGCSIHIHGYDSDHGYVHNGGLVGMYILYPLGCDYKGYINNTRVEGKITFFEDNTDRRAYCKDFMGEVMNWTYEYVGNSSDFKPDEIKDYSKDLLPHYCTGNNFSEEVFSGDCEQFGFTTFTCNECGEYSYKGNYTKKLHSLGEAETVTEPTLEIEGLSKSICTNCQAEVYEILPVLEPVVEEPVIIEEEPKEIEVIVEEAKDSDDETFYKIVFISGGIICIILIGAIIAVLVLPGKKKRR